MKVCYSVIRIPRVSLEFLYSSLPTEPIIEYFIIHDDEIHSPGIARSTAVCPLSEICVVHVCWDASTVEVDGT
jgi:hypothetical protein